MNLLLLLFLFGHHRSPELPWETASFCFGVFEKSVDYLHTLMAICNNCASFCAIVLAPSSLRIEPVGRWFEANIQRRQHGLSSHHSSSSSSSSASSEVNLSSDEEDPNFLLTLDPSEWKVEFMYSITLLLCTSQLQNHPIPPPPRAYPRHLTRVLSCTVGNLTQNEACPDGHLTPFVSKWWSASQAKGFCNSYCIQYEHGVYSSLLLYLLFCWSFENL